MRQIFQRLCNFTASDTTTLVFDGRRLVATGEPLARETVSAIETELLQNRCRGGIIRLRKNGRVAFSNEIVEPLHQRIRNLLFSS